MYKRRFTDRRGVSKTQKHIARNVPDRVTFSVSRDEFDPESKIRTFIIRWISLMRIKHSDFDSIKVMQEIWVSSDTNKATVELKYNH